jgi:hypothetical protein
MSKASYRFRVFSPPKGVLLIVTIIVACFPLFRLMDLYGPDWMLYREVSILIAVIVFFPLTYFLGKLATTFVEVRIEHDGLWINNLPRWSWGKHEDLRVGWLELESWVYKKGKIDGHSISWDRLIFRLGNGEKLLLLPTDDFDERSGFSIFINRLKQAVNAYNARPSTLIPIQNGDDVPKNLIWVWARVLFWLFWCLVTILSMYIALFENQSINWPLFFGGFLMLLAFGYQLWNRIQTIRNAAKP